MVTTWIILTLAALLGLATLQKAGKTAQATLALRTEIRRENK